MSEVKQPGPVSGMLLGRTFLSPAFDYLLIGGGLSLLVVVILLLVPSGYELVTEETLPYFFLLCNSAHFASSTVLAPAALKEDLNTRLELYSSGKSYSKQ